MQRGKTEAPQVNEGGSRVSPRPPWDLGVGSELGPGQPEMDKAWVSPQQPGWVPPCKSSKKHRFSHQAVRGRMGGHTPGPGPLRA